MPFWRNSQFLSLCLFEQIVCMPFKFMAMKWRNKLTFLLKTIFIRQNVEKRRKHREKGCQFPFRSIQIVEDENSIFKFCYFCLNLSEWLSQVAFNFVSIAISTHLPPPLTSFRFSSIKFLKTFLNSRAENHF